MSAVLESKWSIGLARGEIDLSSTENPIFALLVALMVSPSNSIRQRLRHTEIRFQSQYCRACIQSRLDSN